jgi:alpha-ketoglutaric semialdehyde dehydrogenase
LIAMPESDSFQAVDPASGAELPGLFRDASAQEVEAACLRAAEAFRAYRELPGTRRAEFLDAIAAAILERGEALRDRLSRETAYPPARIAGEQDRTVGQLRMFAELLREGSWVEARIDTAQPDRKPAPKPDLRRYRIPIGPVAVFGASNFPQAFSTAGGDTASALAAGCPVVVKAHPAHPGTAALHAEAIAAAAAKTRMPAGVFSLLQGRSHRTGTDLVRDPRIQAVGFTGSFRGGKALMDIAQARPHPIPVYAEMGSSNPLFFLPEAVRTRKDALAAGLAQSLNLGSGQFCTGPGLVFLLAGDESEALAAALLENLRAAPTGTMVHASVRKGYTAALEEKRNLPGVRQLHLGCNPGAHPDTEAQPALLRASGRDFLAQPGMGAEIFGPGCLLVVCADPEEMRQAAESLEGQLTASVHGTEADLDRHAWLFPILGQKAGRLIVNGFPTGVEVCASMHHGGPYPASSFPQYTSVGTAAIHRFSRPICFQDFPTGQLPPELRPGNPLGIWRLVNGEWTKAGL